MGGALPNVIWLGRRKERALKQEEVRILVALERGESARETARLLDALFPSSTTRVRALHVGRVLVPLFYVPVGLERPDSIRREQLAWEQEALRELERQTAPLEEAGFVVELEVTSGSPLAEIRKRAQLWKADLILARPRSGRAWRGGPGGVATGLMQTAPAPVLLCRNVSRAYRVRTILAPIDFSPFAEKAVEWALLLAALAKARVRLLHVLPEASSKWAPHLRRAAIEMVADKRRRLERRLREFGSPAIAVEGAVTESRDPAGGIGEAQRDGVDLMVLGASGRTGLSSIVGSVTRRVARDGRCPTLIVPSASRGLPREVFRRSIARGRRDGVT